MPLADDIKSKGYWQTIIRPTQHIEKRLVDLTQIPVLLQELSINRRGWDFPHVDRSEATQFGNDWVGQDTVWEEFRELWRVTQSGQFVHLAGIRYDWGEPKYLSVTQRLVPGAPLVGIGDSLHRLSEILEFAQRWEQRVAPTEGVRVSLEIGGLLNRQLVVDHPSRTASAASYVSRAAEPFVWTGEIQVGTGLQELWAVARDVATRFYARFGFQANSQMLEDWQRKIGQ